MPLGGERTGPGDVAVTCGVESVATFTEDPARSMITLPEGEVIGGNVLLASGKAFLRHRELVHERKADVVLFAREVHRAEDAVKMIAGFPADLLSRAGFVTHRLN